jgi:3-oxoacyl-(acyl-carrier-protein) synthase
MRKAYINGAGCISAQKSFDMFFSEVFDLNEEANVLPIREPVYSDFITPAAARRMSKGVKNATVAAALALQEANIDIPDAIITGTGIGCIIDSDKFLESILENNEEFLTPTSFIQSTHNTFGANIALGLNCKGYNFNYVHAAVSFESALLDTKMKLEECDASSVLTGGIDELNEHTIALFKLAGLIKKDGTGPYHVLNSSSTGTVFSQGATFFVIEDKMKDSTYAELVDVTISNSMEVDEVEKAALDFLKTNGMDIKDIDAIILGFNGDVAFDIYYRKLAENSFAPVPQVYYKHLSGEYNTSSAFGFWVGANILRHQQIPNLLQVNKLRKSAYKTVLLYNQYRGIDHSFILISQCQNIN